GASSSAASASCGTHFGCTKLVASTVVSPASASLSRNSNFTSTGTVVRSFCKPSRGPTSQIVTRSGSEPSWGNRSGSPSSRTPIPLPSSGIRFELLRRIVGARVRFVADAGGTVVVVGVVVDLTVDVGVHPLDLRDVVEGQRFVRRGLDDERAAAEDAIDEPVFEPHAVDAAHRDVDPGAFDHALPDDHAVGGDDEVRGAPPDERRQEQPDDEDAAHNGDGDQ